ncbi:tRNA lysidine(34) synthetase TilS [Chitinophagaceae bacterium IBVUCB1]|nr:tRNA lysidine(34) synthetase TilS [Chitinophagaceae bacterium IBVUCB1]
MNLQDRFTINWHTKRFADKQQQVLLAVSGGGDSMAMAHLCLQAGISFAVAHCNFQLRGSEADKDEQLVRDWCFDNNIILHHVRFDTKQKMEEWGKAVQETARILRYEWLEQIRSTNGYSHIATAHHANDNVETLLMNLFKGTGMAGLHGIQAKNDKVIRPLLFATKKEIESYIADNNIPYRDDASNATDNYLRNAVRHHIVPAAEQWFADAVVQVNESIARFAEAEVLYKKAIAQERKKLMEQRGNDYYISVAKLQRREPLHTICYELFQPFGFSSGQVPDIIRLLDAETGRYISSATHSIIRNRHFLILTTLQTTTTDFIQIDSVPCKVHAGNRHFHFSTQQDVSHLPADAAIASIDADKITYPLILRKWKTGDHFYPLGMGMKKKKLSKLLIDNKVPLHEKEHIWLIESNKRIVWVAGIRLDERFKVTGNTKQVLTIKMTD